MLRLCIVLALLAIVFSVDRSKFRTCQDTGFCRRFRDGPTTNSLIVVEKTSVVIGAEQVTAKLTTASPQQPLKLDIRFLQSGSVRVRITQQDIQRWQPTDLLLEAAFKYSTPRVATVAELPADWAAKDPASFTALSFNTEDVLIIQHNPLKLSLYHNGLNTINVNDRNFLHYEHDSQQGHRANVDTAKADELAQKRADRHQGKKIVDYGEDGLAIYADGTREEKGDVEVDNVAVASEGESFQGHFDSMPRGPRSVGLDFSFPCASDIYGLPEHSTPLSLPTTGPQGRYRDPYRLYTLDVFEYELQEPMALYGSIPVLWSHGTQCPAQAGLRGNTGEHTAGVFWFNPSESFIDILNDSNQQQAHQHGKQAHWLSESGEIDFFLMPGNTPKRVSQQFAALVGTQQLPPMFSLGYHQCRWNYRDERDVAQVTAKFEELDFPFDVIWLDIEHTDGKRYFTWDKKVFPTPLEMQKGVAEVGRKVVTIVDPHIKRDDQYSVHHEATQKGLYIKTKDGKQDFDGWCWPGSSSYLDFTSPHVREWWAQQFRLDKYVGSSLDLFIWNDMNEPSVFNGPEVSMPKDALSLSGVEHREWHNLYGLYMQMATQQGLIDRAIPLSSTPSLLSSLQAAVRSNNIPESQKPRPFVLTRSFWAGSQRYGAMWTGDNLARWDHLEIAAPMLLSINLAGLSFAGADVGGFMGDPSAELFTRWFQSGAFTPFFRGHAHHDTKRREPWVYGEPHTSLHRAAAMLRYSLLPLWYNSFFEAYVHGYPVLRAMFYEFPALAQASSIDDQWLIGDSLLVKPIVQSGQSSVSVFLPPNSPEADDALWYDFHTLEAIRTTRGSNFQHLVSQVSLETIPLFLRAGAVLPRKLRLRRSATLMRHDPYTLFITPTAATSDAAGKAEGMLYLDDETSFAYIAGAYEVRHFFFTQDVFRNRRHAAYAEHLATLDRSTPIARSPSPTHVGENLVERLVFAGQRTAPAAVRFRPVVTSPSPSSKEVADEQQKEEEKKEVALDFVFDAAAQTVTVKLRPVNAMVADDWDVVLMPSSSGN